ncbi:MAG TPA: multiheme c-type cytochrome [Candidatus Angelobacter sp.]|nr:multiheme c-type cytochrome [Candidatus Angelobacter sp.]
MKSLPFGKRYLLVTALLTACLAIPIQTRSQSGRAPAAPMATQDRVRNPGWWPTKGTPARNEYLGPAACAECHFLRAGQRNTPMGHAATPAADAEILRAHDVLVFRSGQYKFEISRAREQFLYSVSDGKGSLSQPLDWAFGTGEVGQTYVFKRNEAFYESRVSFYPKLQALDLTLGHRAPIGTDVAGALGRAMPASETRLCFGCHTTASTTSGNFDVDGLIPGVTCEACHGPGARHVVAERRKQIKLGARTILNPAHLNPVDSVDFCGACHRTAWDVALTSTTGVANVRFQPYRLEKSRCWGKGDARLTCMACHDPHRPLVHDPVTYDSQCLSCHLLQSAASGAISSNHPGKACPVGTNKCVSCHMAKYEIPGSHAEFTDHWIRIVKGSAYPD